MNGTEKMLSPTSCRQLNGKRRGRSYGGRQDDCKDSLEGWPTTTPYQWWRRHDEYNQT